MVQDIGDTLFCRVFPVSGFRFPKLPGADALTIGGKRAEVNHRLKFDEARSRPEAETVQLFGKDWGLAAGRVFLIDFVAETPVVSQKNVPLPKIPAPLKSTQAAEQLARAV